MSMVLSGINKNTGCIMIRMANESPVASQYAANETVSVELRRFQAVQGMNF